MGQWIGQEPLNLAALLAETADPGSGAFVIFAGTVRNENKGRPVSSLSYDAHPALAERVLRELEQEVRTRFGVRQCRIRHRVGHLELGEASVLIVVGAAHRPEAFRAARYCIDELKRRAPIWKEEHYADGESRFLDGIPLAHGPDE